mgnify:CR=1 FL=1
MIRDTFFSQTRFVNLCRKEMVENWKSNLLRVALMYGAMAVIMLWSGYLSYRAVGQDTDSTWEFNLVIFMWGLCVFGCLSASFTMERMKSKTGRLSVLMTPATSFEKYFSRWLVFTVVFLIVFLITYKLADYTKVLVYSLVYPENNAIAITPLSHLFGENTDYYTVFKHTHTFVLMIASYFFCQSCFVLGSSVWPKNSFIKTFSAGMIIFIAYVLIVVGFAKLIWPDQISYNPDMSEETAFACLSAPCCSTSAPVAFFVSYLIAIAVFGLFQAVFMANAGGCWDNAKKIVEVDLQEKGTPLHEATVVGDTVGDPFKDTSSVAMNPIIKFTTLFGLLAMEIAISESFRNVAPIAGWIFLVIALIFVIRSFYAMRIPVKSEK